MSTDTKTSEAQPSTQMVAGKLLPCSWEANGFDLRKQGVPDAMWPIAEDIGLVPTIQEEEEDSVLNSNTEVHFAQIPGRTCPRLLLRPASFTPTW